MFRVGASVASVAASAAPAGSGPVGAPTTFNRGLFGGGTTPSPAAPSASAAAIARYRDPDWQRASADNGADAATSTSGLIPVTSTMFGELRQCPKQFILSRYLTTSEAPPVSTGDGIRIEDGVLFGHLARTSVLINSGDKTTHRITSAAFDAALEETSAFLRWYFQECLPRGDRKLAPPLTLLMPAFTAAYTPDGLTGLELRSRPSMLQYMPGPNVWQSFATVASMTLSTADKIDLYARQAFQLYTLRHCADAPSPAAANAGFKNPIVSWSPSTPLFTASLTDTSTSVIGGRVSTLKPLMMPIAEDCSSRGALASFISSTSAAALRGAFLQGTPSTLPDGAGPLDFSYALPPAAEQQTDMALMEHMLRHGAGIIHRIVSEPALSAAAFSTACAKPSLTAAAKRLLPPGAPAPDAAQAVDFYNERCTTCRFFTEGFCRAKPSSEDAVFSLPGMRSSGKKALLRKGLRSAQTLLDADESRALDKPLTDKQRAFLGALRSDTVLIQPENLQRWFGALQYPVVALDFESAGFALPPFHKLRPYGALPFQYSACVYYDDILTEVPQQHAFCFMGNGCDARQDPRIATGESLKAFFEGVRAEAQTRLAAKAAAGQPLPDANADGGTSGAKAGRNKKKKGTSTAAGAWPLVDGLHTTVSKAQTFRVRMADPRTHGTVIGHNVAFERSCFQTIGTVHAAGRSLFEHLVFMDTLKLANESLQHPMTFGSSSLKKLLPALLPDAVQYGDLEIQDGNAAYAAYRAWFRTMTRVLPQSSSPSSSSIAASYEAYAEQRKAHNEVFDAKRRALIEYCNQDTVQMVGVMREMHRIAALAQDPKTHALALGGANTGWFAVPRSKIDATRGAPQ